MKNLIITLGLLLLFSNPLQAQFQARYDSAGKQIPMSLAFTPDSGFVIAGAQAYNGWSPFVMRVDNKGKVIWHYTYLTIPPYVVQRYML